MKLSLVERRAERPAADPWAAAQAQWSRLTGLVAELGRPAWGLDLVLVDDEAMADLNRTWREGDGVTDVLSFSYLEQAGDGSPGLPAGAAGAACDLWLPVEAADLPETTVGEVLLAPSFVLGRCLEQGWDPELEWPLLLVHGALHVLGWDHAEDEQRRRMQELEATLLGRAHWQHPLRERS